MIKDFLNYYAQYVVVGFVELMMKINMDFGQIDNNIKIENTLFIYSYK